MDTSIYKIVFAVILLMIGLILVYRSFFNKADDKQLTVNIDDRDLPIVPRESREQYLANTSVSIQDNDIASLDEFDVSNEKPEVTDLTELNTSINTAEISKESESAVDALGSTLSSLEHATADILPVVEKGNAEEFSGNSSLLNNHLQNQEENQIDILENANEVVSVTLLPNANINFDGEAVMDILDAFGLKFGEMSLYHRYVNPKGTGMLLFSVMRYSSKEESIPFDIQTLADETVDGLTFFMPLPHPKPVEAIGGMLSLAGAIAKDLNATVHTDDFVPLTSTDKDDMKAYVANYQK